MNRRQFIAASAALVASPCFGQGGKKMTYSVGAWPWHTDCQVHIASPANPKTDAQGRGMYVLAGPSVAGGTHVATDILNAVLAANYHFVSYFFPGATGGESYGSRHALLPEYLQYHTATYNLTAKPIVFAQSRAGLDLLSFVGEHPELVLRYAALFPVTDPYVYPPTRAELLSCYGQTQAWFDVNKASYTPNSLASGASNVPGCIWHGDSDAAVPKATTTDIYAPLAHAYVKTLAGFGHENPSAQTTSEIVSFLDTGAIPAGASIPSGNPPPQGGYVRPDAEIAALDAAWAALKLKL